LDVLDLWLLFLQNTTTRLVKAITFSPIILITTRHRIRMRIQLVSYNVVLGVEVYSIPTVWGLPGVGTTTDRLVYLFLWLLDKLDFLFIERL
jgi:hypothetical protein